VAKTKVHGEYLDPSVISGQTQVTAVGADSVLIFDATDNALKKALLSDVIETVGSTPSFTSATISGDLTVDTTTLVVDSSNNRLGIGTASPQAHLDINTETAEATTVILNGEANQDKILKFRHYANSEAAADGYAGFIGSVVDNVLTLGHFNSSNAEIQVLHVTEGADVGISTTSPDAKLHINQGTASSGGTGDQTNANNHALYIENSGSNGYPRIVHKSASSIVASVTNAETGKNMYWGESTDTGYYYFRGRDLLVTDGDVGIGESSPAAPLHVEHSSGTAFDSNTEVTESTIISNKAGTDNSGVNNYASLGLHVADGATSQGFMSYVRDGNNSGYFAFSGRNGSSSYKENMRITSEGLWTTAGLHIVHSSTPNNFVAGASADTWYDIDNYNYQNQHNGTAGVDGTAMTITLLTWANQTTTYGYIVRLYIIHGAYSANTHTLYGSAGIDSSLDAGDSYSRTFGEKYDVGGNGAIVYATGHTDIQNLKVAVRFNNHTSTNYNPLTLQIKTNGPPASGTTPSMKVMRL